MLKSIKRKFWWLEIRNNIKRHIQEYTKCQQNKVQNMENARELYLLKILKGLWQEISIDIIESLSKSNNNKRYNSGYCGSIH